MMQLAHKWNSLASPSLSNVIIQPEHRFDAIGWSDLLFN